MTGYRRNTFDVSRYTIATLMAGRAAGFIVESLDCSGRVPLLALQRKAMDTPRARLYLSGGMHGDEPAGALALLHLLHRNALPRDLNIALFPLLNPSGMARRIRENADGIDINRDYRRFQTEEARAHRDWLQHFAKHEFDLSISLHEDWEAKGFYLYEVSEGPTLGLADQILASAEPWTGIDRSTEIDKHPADNGVIHPNLKDLNRKTGLLKGDDWAEALFLHENFSTHGYTFETPSNTDLHHRIQAHLAALRLVFEKLGRG